MAFVTKEGSDDLFKPIILTKRSINIYHLLLAPNFGCNDIHKKIHYDKV